MMEKTRSADCRRMRTILVPVLCAVMTLLIFKTILFIGYVPSSSMEPTLHKNSIILGLRPHGELKTGDIIIFRHEGKLLVKRIAACGGEEIERNGEMITVPDSCYYVLGDNTADSYDSRYWAEPFVKETDVAAIVL